MFAIPQCAGKVKELSKQVEAQYCQNIPQTRVRGEIIHMNYLPHELHAFEKECRLVLQRYARRVRWLLTGSRRLFGCVAQMHSAFLVDTSGSMVEHMQELKESLKQLVWEQLLKCVA